jgi:energy-converting hydrogenase Eha subunit C
MLTCIFFQQFVNTSVDVECPVLGHKIPSLKLFESMHATLIATAYYIDQVGISATLYTSIQEVLG